MEEWKNIKGSRGFYQVSDLGRIKSLPRKRVLKERILKQTPDKDGYHLVSLSVYGCIGKLKCHRLVALHFIPNPEDKPQVNHKDGNRSNNRKSNLEWATPSENHLHAYRVLGRENPRGFSGRFGKLHHNSKPVIQLDLNGNFIKEWECGQQVKRGLGADPSDVSKACRDQNKIVKGFKWQFKNKQT